MITASEGLKFKIHSVPSANMQNREHTSPGKPHLFNLATPPDYSQNLKNEILGYASEYDKAMLSLTNKPYAQLYCFQCEDVKNLINVINNDIMGAENPLSGDHKNSIIQMIKNAELTIESAGIIARNPNIKFGLEEGVFTLDDLKGASAKFLVQALDSLEIQRGLRLGAFTFDEVKGASLVLLCRMKSPTNQIGLMEGQFTLASLEERDLSHVSYKLPDNGVYTYEWDDPSPEWVGRGRVNGVLYLT